MELVAVYVRIEKHATELRKVIWSDICFWWDTKDIEGSTISVHFRGLKTRGRPQEAVVKNN